MNQTKVKQDGLILLYVRPSIIADDLAFINQGNDYIVVTREGARRPLSPPELARRFWRG